MSGIWLIEPLPVGNALRLHIQPPAGTAALRLLRNQTGVFSGPNDASATLVWVGDSDAPAAVLDVDGLFNGGTYHYRLYYDAGATWADASGMPLASYQDHGADALLVLLQRLTAGLAVEVARNALRPKTGAVPVQNAPPLWDATPFPVVTVHLMSAAPAERVLGELLTADLELENVWQESEGYLERVQIQIVGWSQNPDERIALRRIIQRLLVANLPVFDDLGLQLVEWSQRDQEDMHTYNAPLYQVVTDFQCLAAIQITSEVGKIDDVFLQVNTHGQS